MEPSTIIESVFMRVVVVDDAPGVRDRVPDILHDLVRKPITGDGARKQGGFHVTHTRHRR